MHVEGLNALTNATGEPVVDHDLSIRSHAPERYLMGELSAGEAEAFVEHYFECEVCAEEVRLGFRFKENARAVFDQERRPAVQRLPEPNGRRWLAWLSPAFLAPITACLLLAALCGYQNFTEIPSLRARIDRLEEPRVIGEVPVLPPSSRGSARLIGVAAGDAFIHLSLAVAAVPPANRYELDLFSDSGKAILGIPLPKLEPEANLTVRMPSAKFPDGLYRAVLMAIHGQDRAELERYRFSVQAK